MFSHPDRIGQPARENHRQLMAQASRRQLRRRHGQQAARTATAAGVTRRLAAAIARAGAVAAQAPGAIWPGGPHPLDSPAGQARMPGQGR
jgi:hypothetical protein